MTERVDEFLEDHADGNGLQDYPSAVDALVASGLLSADRARSWKDEHARLRASMIANEGRRDEEVEAKAIYLLDALYEPVRQYGTEEWDPAIYQRYQEALSTLTGIGVLSFERAQPWARRRAEAFTPPGGWPEGEPDPEMPFVAGELSAVLGGPCERRDGMRVTCLELYSDCVIVRFHQVLPPEPADPVERRELLRTSFELEDDAGTEYRPAPIPTPLRCKPREIRGWPEVLHGWQAFVPGAPLDARAFTLGWREQGYSLVAEVRLRRHGSAE